MSGANANASSVTPNQYVQLAAELRTCLVFEPKKWRHVMEKSTAVLSQNAASERQRSHLTLARTVDGPTTLKRKRPRVTTKSTSNRPSSREEDAMIPGRKDVALPTLSPPNRSAPVVSLAAYLNQPAMVKDILEEEEDAALRDEHVAHCDNGLEDPNLGAWEDENELAGKAMPALSLIEETELKTGRSFVTNTSRHPSIAPGGLAVVRSTKSSISPGVVLPILATMSPRTRQGLARLPPPSEHDVKEIGELEFFVECASESLYQNLKRQQVLRQRRELRNPATRVLQRNRRSLDELLVYQKVLMARRQKVSRKPSQKVPQHKWGTRDEQICMTMEDVNVANLDIVVSRESPVLKDTTSRTSFPSRNYQHLMQEKESALEHERDANIKVEQTLTEIQHFLPLDVIYAFGMGKFASPAQQHATQVLFTVGSRLKLNLLIQAVQQWKQVVAAARFHAMSAASLRIQCWWRQLLAVRELLTRRRIRSELLKRQQALLRILASKQHKSASIITDAIRRFAHQNQRRRHKIRMEAARVIQEFWREQQALWAALRIQLRKKHRLDAAVCIQKHVRGHQARVKKRIFEKIRRVELKKQRLERQTRERKREMKVHGAVIMIQRAFRKWQRRRILSLRRRRAQFEKDKLKILKVQSHFRGRKARKFYIRHLLEVFHAIPVLQRAWRCYRARQIRSALERERGKQRQQWITEIKERRKKHAAHHLVPQEMKKKWNQIVAIKDKVVTQSSSGGHNSSPSPREVQAATKLQARWRGIRLRRRLCYEKARECELQCRALNKTRKHAAICIQKRIRGIQGRAKAWEWMVHVGAKRIQCTWRGFRTRRELARLHKAHQAIHKMQIRWKQKRNKETQRLRVRAARHIQGLARIFLGKRWLRKMVHRQQFLAEQEAVGKVLMEATRRRVKDELLLQSFINKNLAIADESETLGKTDIRHVDTLLYRVDLSKSLWKRRGYDGVWQDVFRSASGGSAGIDNSRFVHFLKALPHSFINKTSFPTQTVDLIFAKMKEPKARTISFARFNKAMAMIWQEKFAPILPDKKKADSAASESTTHSSVVASSNAQPEDYVRYLKFMHQFVLPSTIQNGKFRKTLEDHCTQRILWAVTILRRFATRLAAKKCHDHFLIVYKERVQLRRNIRCASSIQRGYRRYRFCVQMKMMLASMFAEYIDHTGRTAMYKHIATGKVIVKRPIFLKGVECKNIIPLPFPGEEFHAFCERHEDSTNLIGKVPAEVYCVQCEDVMCAICFARDHSKRQAFQIHETRDIALCSHCRTETATRECLHCGNGHVPFCDACFPYVHKPPINSPRRSSRLKSSLASETEAKGIVVAPANPLDTHRFQSLVVMCIECSARVAQWKCETCEDVYCKRCLSSLHAKGQRQHHQCHRVSYFSVLREQAEQGRALKEQKELEARLKQREEERKRRELDLKHRNESATIIQALVRSFLERKQGKAYMKLVRQTKAAKAQRLKDERIRASILYKMKNVFGMAPTLNSDTKQEIAARQHRLEMIKQTLFFHRHITTTDANGVVTTRKKKRWTKKQKALVLKAARSWCVYDVRVKILRGEWENCVGSILSTQNLLHTGFVVVFLPLANCSVVLNWEHIAPYDDDEILRQPYEPATQTLLNAASDFHIKLAQVVSTAARKARLLYLQTIEFHDIVRYAWVVEYNKHEKKEEFWNVVLNKRTFEVPRAMELIEQMEIEQRQEVEQRVAIAKSKLLDLLHPFHSKNKTKLAVRRAAVVFTTTKRGLPFKGAPKSVNDKEGSNAADNKPTLEDEADALVCARFWHERIMLHDQFGGKKAAKFAAACSIAPHSTRECWLIVRTWQWIDLYEPDGYEAHAKTFLNLANDIQLYIAGELAPLLASDQYKDAANKLQQLLKLKEETLQLLVFNASQQQNEAIAQT